MAVKSRIDLPPLTGQAKMLVFPYKYFSIVPQFLPVIRDQNDILFAVQ